MDTTDATHPAEPSELGQPALRDVVDRLLDEESVHLADLAEFLGKNINLRAEPLYRQEQFDIVPL